MTDSSIKLKVGEAVQEDVYKGIVRINSVVLKELGVESGNIIIIKGKKEFPAIALRARPLDENKPIIRMDVSIRKSVGVSIDDEVELRKAETAPAQSVTLAPNDEQTNGLDSNDPRYKKIIQFAKENSKALHKLVLHQPVMKGNPKIFKMMGIPFQFIVTATTPKSVVIINENTKFIISDKSVSEHSLKIPDISYEDLGGLKDEIDQVREMIELPMKHPEIFEKLGIGAPKGVLLSGPPGTGKTLLAKAVASETDSQFLTINGPEIMSKFYGESEKKIREIFDQAENNAPSIIFIDEIDSIAPKRDEVQGEVERRVVAQLLTLMDGMNTRGQVVVIAATNRPDSLDPALRRPGRFDREISINVPDRRGRYEILQVHTRGMPLNENVNLDEIADMTHAYTGADLESLCKEAAMKALRKYIPNIKELDLLDKEDNDMALLNYLDKIKISMSHFIEAFRKIEPSAMREVLIKKPNVSWKQIGGLEKVKESLKEMVEWPLKHPEHFKAVNIKPAKGLLLYGPPGTGKTLLAKAIATEANANFISVKGPELISKWVGESEKHIREIFKKARQVAPSVIFFDEFDSIGQVRSDKSNSGSERAVNQLLTELDGVEELSGVVVIAATNRLDLIDQALLRPGRFDEIVEITLPNKETRRKIFKVHIKDMPLDMDEINIENVINRTENMTGADIANIAREAGMFAIRRAQLDNTAPNQVKVNYEDFTKSFEKIKNKKEEKQKTHESYFG